LKVNEFTIAKLPPITLPKNAGLVYVIDRLLTPSEDMSAAISKIKFVSPLIGPPGPQTQQVETPRQAEAPSPPTRSEEVTFQIMKDIKGALLKTGKHKLLIEYIDESIPSLMIEDFSKSSVKQKYDCALNPNSKKCSITGASW
jgi:hypothetical protein